jgi:GNAT superfamily N-acetyltransferase
MSDIKIKALSPALAADYFDFFDNRAFSDNSEWSCCYCTYFHMNAQSEREVDDEVSADGGGVDALRRALRGKAQRLIDEGTLRGYLAYANGIAIGFCNTNDKSMYVKHINEIASNAGERVKVTACYVIAPEYRGKGIATALLERAISDARADGYTAIEAYPLHGETGVALNYVGPERMYEKAGFVVIDQLGDRYIVRKELAK